MTEEDKAEVRALALDVIRDYRDRGCPEPAPISAELMHEMMDVARLRGRARRVRPDADGGDGARRRRRPPGRPRPSDAAARDAFPVVVIGCGESGLLAGIRLEGGRASRSRSSRRTPASAAPGGRTRTRAPASTSATTSTATASSRATTGPSSSPSSPSCRPTSSGVMTQARHRAARPVRDRGARRRRGTTTPATWSVRVRAADGDRGRPSSPAP